MTKHKTEIKDNIYTLKDIINYDLYMDINLDSAAYASVDVVFKNNDLHNAIITCVSNYFTKTMVDNLCKTPASDTDIIGIKWPVKNMEFVVVRKLDLEDVLERNSKLERR